MFRDNNATVPEVCSPLASTLNGTWIMPAAAQFHMGEYNMQGLLDGFGKYHRFTISHGQLCFEATMMGTVFWNTSVADNKVAPDALFMETAPPRGYSMMDNLQAVGDNTFVNTIKVGSTYLSITDSQKMLEFDPMTLRIKANFTWDDHLDRLNIALGSAHPLPEPGSAQGCLLGLHPERDVIGAQIKLYRFCPDRPSKRIVVATLRKSYLPYLHSFGISASHAVLPLMHFRVDVPAMMMNGGTIAPAFKPQDKGKDTLVMLQPLDGSAPTTFSLPGDVYYTHIANTYENATAVICDIVTYDQNPFSEPAMLANWRDKARRDRFRPAIVQRWVMHTAGARKGRIDVQNVSAPGRITDFTNINRQYNGVRYCFYYAVEWRHNSVTYDDMAIVRQDVCTGTRSYFHRDNAFPSEPTFVPRSGVGATGAEDDGVLLFTILNGTSGTSSLVQVDAATMALVSESPLGVGTGFTTHGEWYEGLLR